MATLEEVLKQAGYTNQQINNLDQRVIDAFSGVLTRADKELATAKAEREAAERAQQSNVTFYETKIVPSLTQWEDEKTRLDNDRARIAAEAAYYRTQNEEARGAGFVPSDAPTFAEQSRDTQGRYVAGSPNGTPGSPSFDVNQVYQRAGDAIGLLTDIQWEHQRLYGEPMPVSPTELVRKADQARLDPRTYASRTFNWDQRKAEIEKKRTEEHDAKIASDAVAENDRKWAERVGSNPDVRMAADTRYSDIQRARRNNEIPDPLNLNDQQRKQVTAQMIRRDLQEQAS